MRSSGFIRFIVLTSLAVFICNPFSPVQARLSSAAEKYPELAAKADAEGSVRVIVLLDIGKEFVPEGYLSRDDVIRQRQAIQDAQKELTGALEKYQANFHALFTYVPYAAVEVDKAVLDVISSLPIVLDVQEDKIARTTLASSTQVIGAPTVWNAGVTGSGWTVAVLDTGIQWDHPFFGGPSASRVVSEACYSYHEPSHNYESLCPAGWDQDSQETGHAADATTPLCDPTGDNLCAHGTHVAGIAAGSGTSYNGVAPGANIIAVQVFTRFNLDNDCGGTVGSAPCIASYNSDQMLGLQRIYNLRSLYSIASVNMSLGGGLYSSYCDTNPLKAYIDTLLSVGISTIIASGNNGSSTQISAPACISTAVAVGATTDVDTVASFSNSNSLIDLLAPGVSIDSSIPVSAYDNYSGTSMATPHVAGAIALLKSFNSGLTPSQILTALQNTGVNVTDPRNSVTKKRIQVDAAANNTSAAFTWVGNTTAWDLASNWSTAQIPTGLNSVTIPASPTGGQFPLVTTTANAYQLTVQNGASMAMTAGTLNISKNFTVGSSGVFNASGGTTVFQGTTAQAISMPDNANNHFYHIQIGNGVTHQTVTASSTLDVNGNLTISTGARFSPGSNTVRVAGNWVDADGQFNPGTSTITFDGSGQTAQVSAAQIGLLQETFSAYDSLGFSYFSPDGPAGWVVENTLGGANYPWFFTGWARNPNSALNGHARHYRSTLSGNTTTWLFTPAMQLYSGFSYQLQYRYGIYSYDGGSRTLRVSIGNTPASSSMTTILRDFTNLANTTWNTDVVNFTVAADGIYYIGFRASTTTSGDDISVDDITVSGTPKLLFYNLNVSAGGTGIILGDNAMVKNNLVVNGGGNLDLAAYNLTVEGTLTNNGRMSQTKTVPASTATTFLRITNAAATTTKYYGVDITPAAGMGSTIVSIWGNQASCTTNPADALIRRCFAITPGSPQNATVRLWYTEAERNSQLANALLLWHGTSTHPTVWTQVGDGYLRSESTTTCTSGGGLACYLQANNVASYSPFGLGSGGTPTAIHLRSLKAASGTSLLLLLALLAAAVAVAAAGLLIIRRWGWEKFAHK